MNPEQKQDMHTVFRREPGTGNLDYVTAWYRKSAVYMQDTQIRAAFVSTNSICQGEQAVLLWKKLFSAFHTVILFACRPFIWNNEARGQARVHCVIIGFSCRPCDQAGSKFLFSRREVREVPHINAYLTACPDIFAEPRRTPLQDVPPMVFGSMPKTADICCCLCRRRKS